MFTGHTAHEGRRLGRDERRRPSVLRTFVQDDGGQDVIEYGLLSAFFGIVAIAAWLLIQANLRAAYLDYDQDVQGLWQSPPPGGS